MPRNLDRRVELLGPVEAPEQQERIDEILRVMLADDELAWELNDRRWQRVETVRGVRAQRELQRLARRRSQPG
jgi:polyphosphate kinase